MRLRRSLRPPGLVLFLSLASASTAFAQVLGEEAALEKHKKYMERQAFLYHTKAREHLAKTRAARPLSVLLADYAKPKEVASKLLAKPVVEDFARYTLATMFGRYYGHWTWDDQLAALRDKHKSPVDIWLWVNTLGTDSREKGPEVAIEVAKNSLDIRLRAAAITALAKRDRVEVLTVVAETCAAVRKMKSAGERRLMIGALSNAILANKGRLSDDTMQQAMRAYIGLLEKAVKLTRSAKMVIVRHLAATIGKDRRYIEPEPWIQLLDQKFEPPKRSGHTVAKPRFFGIEAEGDRICYLVDMSNSMLKPIDRELLPKGPITGANKKKRKRKRGELATEDDIPWHLVKTRFDLAREHLKLSMQRLTKDKRFCVVWFGDDSGLLKATPGMIKATKSNLARVIKELDSLRPEPLPMGRQQRDAPHGWLRGQTNMHGGLRKAFSLRAKGFATRHEYVDLEAMAQGCDTIFLLSDGAPGAGKYIATKDILRAVRRLNQTRRIAIHGISIGMDSDLLKRLAAENGGRYARR